MFFSKLIHYLNQQRKDQQEYVSKFIKFLKIKFRFWVEMGPFGDFKAFF